MDTETRDLLAFEMATPMDDTDLRDVLAGDDADEKEKQPGLLSQRDVTGDVTDEELFYSVSCSCGSAAKLIELVKVNHFWQRDYTTLQHDCETLRLRNNKLQRENSDLQQRVGHLQSEIRDLQQRVGHLQSESRDLQQRVGHLQGRLKEQLDATATATVEDIEALKFQCVVYKEDFQTEQKELAQTIEAKEKLEEELRRLHFIIDELEKQNDRYRSSQQQVREDKHHIVTELSRLLTPASQPLSSSHPDSSPPRYSPPHYPPRVTSPNRTAHDHTSRQSDGQSLPPMIPPRSPIAQKGRKSHSFDLPVKVRGSQPMAGTHRADYDRMGELSAQRRFDWPRRGDGASATELAEDLELEDYRRRRTQEWSDQHWSDGMNDQVDERSMLQNRKRPSAPLVPFVSLDRMQPDESYDKSS